MTYALIVTPHPVTLQGQRKMSAMAAQFAQGDTLAALLERQGVRVGEQWAVAIGGVLVPENRWHLVRPKHGYLIEARRVPQKDVLRIVAIAALSYFTFGAGGLGSGGLFAAGGAIGGGSLAGGTVLRGGDGSEIHF